jgi:hypothetical protein
MLECFFLRVVQATTPGLSMSASQAMGMTQGPTIRQQLDSLSMTVHEVVGRVEMGGRDIVNLQEDRVSNNKATRAGCARAALAPALRGASLPLHPAPSCL